MKSEPFKVGDHVYVLPDPDVDVFQGVHGVVEAVGVQCMAGEGMLVDSKAIGRFKGTYEMFGRMS